MMYEKRKIGEGCTIHYPATIRLTTHYFRGYLGRLNRSKNVRVLGIKARLWDNL
jgi:hypothetical protein